MTSDILESEHWAGVVFRMAPGVRIPSRSGAPSARRFLPTRSLALRFEALIRVAANPEPYARRLARRLQAAPALAARVLRRPRDEGRAPPWDDLVEDAQALARTALRVPAPRTG
jgi:hypothetical protein